MLYQIHLWQARNDDLVTQTAPGFVGSSWLHFRSCENYEIFQNKPLQPEQKSIIRDFGSSSIASKYIQDLITQKG